MDLLNFLKELTDPENIIRMGGLGLLIFVIFAETGLLIGFFLPGDSLVFIAGLICATEPQLLNVSISVLLISLIIAAFIGNITGYLFGKKVGPALFKRDDSLIFKKRYLALTRSFYEKHGAKALVLGRFLPIIRTFAPILAGVIHVKWRAFLIYNITGACLWIGSLTTLGYLLGPMVKDYLGLIVIGLIIITLIPVIRTFLNERKQRNNGGTE